MMKPGKLISYEDALRLVHEYGNGSAWVNHCIAVSRLAMHFGEIFARKYAIDVDFLRRAALLHDIGRCRTHHPILHGVEGFHLLSGMGHHREAFVCASHVLFGLERHEAVNYGLPDADFIPRSLEEQLVPVIDSLVEGDKPTTIESRLASIQKRYCGNQSFLDRIAAAALKTRQAILRLNEEFGISMEKTAFETLSCGSNPPRP